MKEIAIISGKGGTGKTSITAALSSLDEKCSIVDCDVDAANLSLICEHEVFDTEDFMQGKKYTIDMDKCVKCGKCISLCRFDAINDDYVIDPVFCEGCGVCSFFCMNRAIEGKENNSGTIFTSKTERGPFYHARLGIGEGNSGKLVARLREMNSMKLLNRKDIPVTYLDGPPGTGCPVIATIAGVNAVLLVTEPSISAIHDLKRISQLCKHFRIKTFLCINKADINTELSDQIKTFCQENDIELSGQINYDPLFLQSQKEGKNIIDFASNETVDEIKQIHKKLSDFIKNG